MNPRRRLLATAFAIAALPVHAGARRMPRFGLLSQATRDTVAKFKPERDRMLAELGFHEGRNIELVWRYTSEGDMDSLARSLVAERVDVLLTEGSAPTRALQRATRTIPIVTVVGDPVAMGFAKSLAHPGGNITGTTFAVSESQFKALEFMQQLVPDLKCLAIFGRRENPVARDLARPLEEFAHARGLRTEFFLMDTLASVERDMRTRSGPGRCACAFSDVTLDPRAVVEIARRLSMPTMFPARDFVELGGLLSYELRHRDPFRRNLALAGKILGGMKPADIPFELPTDSEFAINLRVAKALGIAVPPEVLVRADYVYE